MHDNIDTLLKRDALYTILEWLKNNLEVNGKSFLSHPNLDKEPAAWQATHWQGNHN